MTFLLGRVAGAVSTDGAGSAATDGAGADGAGADRTDHVVLGADCSDVGSGADGFADCSDDGAGATGSADRSDDGAGADGSGADAVAGPHSTGRHPGGRGDGEGGSMQKSVLKLFVLSSASDSVTGERCECKICNSGQSRLVEPL